MEKLEFELYDGELKVSLLITEEKKNAVIQRIIQYCIENDCVDGEVLHQNDECLIEAPSVLSDIIDDILEFEKTWK